MKKDKSKRERKKGQAFKPSEPTKSALASRPCSNCGEKGPHFVPPCFGDPGFFICDKKED